MNANPKRTLRRAVRTEIAKLSAEAKTQYSSQIFSRLATTNEIQNARVVALFVSLDDEPSTTDIIEQLSLHKRVVVPRIEGDEMEFYDISEGLQQGAFGIMEPLATTPISPDEIDVMVVPGVAFTRNGNRIGRGKGFYDKYLSRRGFRAYTIGVCYPSQIVENIPTEKHDKTLDSVVTI